MFKLPELQYPYDALEPFIDEETMRVHHDGHHATYVKNLNDALVGHNEFLEMDIEKLLKSLDKVPQDIRAKVKNNAGGHYHHSLFWTLMTPNGKKEPKGEIKNLIDKTYKDFNFFKEEFTKSALSVFGSGWTWLILKDGKLSIENTPNQDSPISDDKYPLFVIDLWEHAYYLKFKNKRADYINSWWNVVNWDEIEKRLR